MVLHKTYINRTYRIQKGFTLLEVLVVLALFGIVFGSTLFFTNSTYQRTAFLSERDSIISLLQTARGKALTNVNQQKHGVALHPVGYEGYVLFEGDTFLSSNEATRIFTPSSYKIAFDTQSPTEIVFEQLSGTASYEGYVILVDGNRVATTGISINYEGAISR